MENHKSMTAYFSNFFLTNGLTFHLGDSKDGGRVHDGDDGQGVDGNLLAQVILLQWVCSSG
jgi:hypothetical protein